MRKPDFFIVGAPKCGTTALSYYLKQHPEIFMPEKKEPHFFGSDLNSRQFVRDETHYLSLFNDASSEKRVGEASVWYLYSREAAVEIKKFCPSASIIIMLRNPTDMLYSQHRQFLFNGNEDILDFEAALEAETDRKWGKRIPNNVHLVESLFYRDTVKYAEQVQRYLDTFGKENVHIVVYDDLKADTIGVYESTLRFLDVDETFLPDLPVVNSNKNLRSRSLQNLLRSPPGSWRRLAVMLMPALVRRKLVESLKSLNVRFEPRKTMEPRLRQRLQSEFDEEVERLSALLGRDLTFWSRE